MAIFYTTFTTQGADQPAVVAALRRMRREAYVSPTEGGCTVVYERVTESHDSDEIKSFGAKLSAECKAPVLGAVVHHDAILLLWLFTEGELRDFYDSMPAYYDRSLEPCAPTGGDAAAICAAFGHPEKAEAVERILREDLFHNRVNIHLETSRHCALLKELEIPICAAHITYSDIETNDLPLEEFDSLKFVKVG